MSAIALLTLTAAGLFAGILAGFLGIGGGTVLVPILVSLGHSPVEAVATSSLSIVITAISGTVQNWRMGYLNFSQVIGIGLPAIVTAQIGAELADRFSPYALLIAFGCLLLLNIYLVQFRQRVTRKKAAIEASNNSDSDKLLSNPDSHQVTSKSATYLFLSRVITGSSAGLLAGLFGVGGGVIMVPLQILLLNTKIKTAIQTSLGVIVITAISATTGHAFRGNVLWVPGLILGMGGLLGAQISTRFLPKLSDRVVSLAFNTLLLILSFYIFWQAWQQYNVISS
jgi:uncharacterized membrane protein YfcA